SRHAYRQCPWKWIGQKALTVCPEIASVLLPAVWPGRVAPTIRSRARSRPARTSIEERADSAGGATGSTVDGIRDKLRGAGRSGRRQVKFAASSMLPEPL